MNNNTRKHLSSVIETLNNAITIIENIKDDEQGKYDNLPEGIQQSEKGYKFEECIENFDNALDSLNESISEIESAKD